MSSFGQTLRQAREAKGLTPSLVAKETHILVQIITDMENEDFHRIPAPIYGRGFVRLFAECVGLDPLPLIREFMDIYEGRRAPTVLVREMPPAQPQEQESDPFLPREPAPVVPEPAPVVPEPSPIIPEPAPAVPEPAPIVPEPSPIIPEPAPIAPEPAPIVPEPSPVIPEPLPDIPEQAPLVTEPEKAESIPESEPEQPPVVKGLELFEHARTTPQTDSLFPDSSMDYMPPRGGPLPAADMPQAPVLPPQPQDAGERPFIPAYEGESGPSAAERFRQSLSSVSHGIIQTMRGVPRSAWRIGLLVLGALVVVALIVFGCIKLYQATSTLPTPGPTQQTKTPNTKGGLEILPTDPPQTSPKSVNPPAKTPVKPTSKAPAKTTTTATPTKSSPKTTVPAPKGRLRSTGQKVPPLYID